MENQPISPSPFADEALSCHCWKCYIKAELLQDFGPIKEYSCPKCLVRIRVGDAESFDPLRTADDDSDSISVCPSRRSTIYSESETGGSDDIDNRPFTPDNFDVNDGQTPRVPTNTPAEGDVPDAPPNIAKAFEDVTNFLLNVPTPKRRTKRYSFGGLSNISSSDLSPSKIITNVVEAYKRCSLGLDITESEKKTNDFVDQQGIEIRITRSPDTKSVGGFSNKGASSVSDIRSTGDNSDAANNEPL